MLEFQQKQRLRRILYSKVTLALLFAALLLFGNSTFKLLEKKREAANGLATLEKEIAALAVKEKTLSGRIAALKTERGVEEAIREKFKVAKEGEGVVVVIDRKEKEATMGETNPFSAWWKGIKDFFNK
ncbi:MAG: septum formation initiator family protein [bacterium]|nr:septum formation initiator family protein [bacterium]